MVYRDHVRGWSPADQADQGRPTVVSCDRLWSAVVGTTGASLTTEAAAAPLPQLRGFRHDESHCTSAVTEHGASAFTSLRSLLCFMFFFK